MNILFSVIEALSDIFQFFISAQIVYICVCHDIKIKKSSIFIIVASIFLIGFIVSLLSTDFTFRQSITWLLLLGINIFKFAIGISVIFKKISLSILLTVFISQFTFELFVSGIGSILSTISKFELIRLNIFILFITRLIFSVILFKVISKNKETFVSILYSKIPTYILALVLINLFIASGLIQTAGYQTDNAELQTLLIKILAFANTLCLIVVLVSLLTNVLFRQYQKDINKILENQVQIQLKHYEKSEKINTEIRRFRHDYNNHMNCMKSLVQSGRYDELMDYINNISDAFPQSGFLYNTGNYIADAILTDKLENARKNGTNISFKGIISPSINNTDLCIILGNILDNAVEACEKIDGEKEISVFGGYQHGYFILIAKNPISCHVQTENCIPATTKPDTAYHGFGLQNVESVVKKYDGIMLPECSDDSFTIRLTFNSIQETATV